MGPVQWSDAHRAWVILDHAELSEAFRDGRLLSADRVTPLERVAQHRPASFAKVVELLGGGWYFVTHHYIPTFETRFAMCSYTSSSRKPSRHSSVESSKKSLTDYRKQIDVRKDFAGPLPAWVIAELLGVQADERDLFQGWSDDLATIVFATDPHTTAPEQAIAAADEFSDFFQQLIDRERVEPSNTLMTLLVDGAGDQLSDLELVGACTLILFAGHETTTSLLMNTIGLLATRPELVEDFRTSDTETAIEEFSAFLDLRVKHV